MTTTIIIENINEFVKDFLGSLYDKDTQAIIDIWEGEEIQARLKAIFPKKNRAPRKKTNKDKTAPKRGKSAYIFFCIKARPDIKAANPTMASKDITKELGRQWREMTDEEKKPFLDEAAEDKERYEEEKVGYVPPQHSSDDDQPKEKNEKKKSPKRGKSAYNFFCAEERSKIKAENQDMNNSDILRELGIRWAALKENNQEEFERYKAMSAEDISRMAGMNEGEDVKPVKKPMKRARSAYIFFCQKNRASVKAENPDSDAKEITSILAEMWSVVKDTEEVEEYNAMAEQDRDRVVEEKAEEEETEEEKTEEEETETNYREPPTFDKAVLDYLNDVSKGEDKKAEVANNSSGSSSDSEEEEVKPKRKTKKTATPKKATRKRTTKTTTPKKVARKRTAKE